MPPFRRTNATRGSVFVLYSAAYRTTRDHFDLVRLSTFRRSEVQKIIAAKGSSGVGQSKRHNQRAQRARADRPILCRPPRYQLEHGAQIAVDRIAIPAGLAILPSKSDPGEIVPQRFFRIGYSVLGGAVQLGRKAGRYVHCFELRADFDGIAEALTASSPYRPRPRVQRRPVSEAWRETLSRRFEPRR